MCCVDSDLLLHPELLSTEVLVQILVERKIKMDNLKTVSRERLIQIFNQFCLPHSQRKFKDTGRGKILNKQQEERTTQSSGKTREYTSPMCGSFSQNTKERIKPAIENCDFANLSIKLVSSNVTDNWITNDCDMIQTNKRKLNQISSNSPSCQPEVKKQKVKIMWP